MVRLAYGAVAGEKDLGHTTAEEGQNLQRETVAKLRTLSHDLSNYIETIMQASYLLAQAKLDDNNKKWLGLVDKASQDAARVNREIREILRSQTEPGP
jgi:signal transduction histidine kinase